MTKIEQAKSILKLLGLPPAQQNDMAALTLLVLAQLNEEAEWTESRRQSLRIHDILVEIEQRYQRKYAENTRETIRRQVIHQFEQAGIVDRNPDEPTLPTNSPRTHYALSDSLIRTIRTYQTPEWAQSLQEFLENQTTLLDLYQKKRQQHKIPLVYQGKEYLLSSGKHNQLQIAIVNEFGGRFASGASLLYLGDTENKTLILDADKLKKLNIPVSLHDKLPDVILYNETQEWLYLIEAVTSHGAISHKRHLELEQFLQRCTAHKIYMSAFSDFVTLKNYLAEIAWETHVWIAEIPDHLIHFNGSNLLKPSK